MHYIRFVLTKTSSAKFESIFPLGIFIYIIDFFINLQMTTEWAFAFLNPAVIIFCSRYSLNIQVIKSHHFFLCKMQHPSFQSSDFGGISLHRDRRRKIILTLFFSCDFTIVTADVITYYIICLLFPDPQTKFS